MWRRKGLQRVIAQLGHQHHGDQSIITCTQITEFKCRRCTNASLSSPISRALGETASGLVSMRNTRSATGVTWTVSHHHLHQLHLLQLQTLFVISPMFIAPYFVFGEPWVTVRVGWDCGRQRGRFGGGRDGRSVSTILSHFSLKAPAWLRSQSRNTR